MTRIFMLLMLCFSAIQASAATGTIEGDIRDENNKPLPGVIVRVSGTELGAKSDPDGHFRIRNIAYGSYTLEFSYISYESKKIEVLVDKESLIVNISMQPEQKTISGVTVKATVKRDNMAGLLMQQKNLATVSDGISAESIKKSPDRNTSEVLKRVPGVSINEGKFAIVRGLPDRYNMATLNGMMLPSTEADRKAFSFDLFPSGILDNITIIKAATPDMPADFAGGVIDMNTKDIPNSNFVQLSPGTGMNTQGTFASYYDSKNGKRDWLGLDDGSRAIPAAFPATDSFYSSTFTRLQKAEASKLLDNNWEIKKHNSMLPNRVFQGTAGYAHTFKSQAVFGVTGALTYNRTQRLQTIERNDFELDDVPVFTYTDTVARDLVLAGAILNAGLKLNADHKIILRNSFTINSEDATIKRLGDHKQNEQLIQSSSSQFTSNTLLVNHLSGDHTISSRKIRVQWAASQNRIKRDVPDLRKTYYVKNYNDPYDTTFSAYVPVGKASPNFSGKFYSTLEEKISNGKLDVSMPFTIGNNLQFIKAGGFVQRKQRDFSARVLGYVVSNIGKFDNDLLELPEQQIFDPANMGETGFRIDDITQPTDQYHAASQLNAGYLMFDNKFLKHVRAVWGVRYEDFYQHLTTSYAKEDVVLKNNFRSWLPSLNLTYALNAKTNLRLCAYKTLSRPEFREMSRFSFYDFNTNAVVQGFDSLVQASIQNYDLRYELFPSKNELFTVSLFYKYFRNPVEQVFFSTGAGSRIRYFQNGDFARDLGLEIEFRKSLAFLGKNESSIFKQWTVFGNLAVIRSRVKLKGVSAEATSDRPLQGQSPYLINLGTSLHYPAWNLSATLLYNRIGERLSEVGNYSFPDIYENSRDVIDFQLAKKIHSKLDVRINFGDLLHQPFIFYQNNDSKTSYNNSDNVIQKTRVGSNIGLSLGYSF